MLAVALLLVLLVAKLLAAVTVPPTGLQNWLVLPLDDVVLALLFAAVLPWLPRVLARLSYAGLVLYAGINVALVHALGTPLVSAMLRGADAAMGDSVARYLQFAFLWPIGVVGVVGWLAARCVHRHESSRTQAMRLGGVFLAAAAVAVWCWLPPAPCPAWRNAVLTLVRSVLPRSIPPAPEPVAPDLQSSVLVPSPLAALQGAARGRSLVFVVLESAAPRFLRQHGAAEDPMPFLTSLAATSLVATDACCVYPESILGQLAILHAVAPAPDHKPEQYRELAVPSLAESLAPHGYRSALVHAGRFQFLGMHHVLAASGFDYMADAATISGQHESSFGIDEESAVAALLAWIDQLPPGTPFVAAWLPIAGHHPYASPPGGPFPYDTQLGCYRNALHWCDRNLRTLWAGVQARRPAQELVLCVIGDHGQAFGEHDGNFGHTFALFDENVRVPFVLHAPGITAGLAPCSLPCSHLDVVPTVLDLFAVAAAPGHQGRSLLRDATPRPAFFFTDWGDLQVGVRDGTHKLVHTLATGRDQLFALDADPGERNDLSGSLPAEVERLRGLALAWLRAR